MKKPEDSQLTPEQYRRVRQEAERLLQKADALGRFPTPIDVVMQAAEVVEVKEDVLNEGFLAKLRREAGDTIKRALKKVAGVFTSRGRLVFIDRSLQIVKQSFIRLHETAHGFLPWQRDLYTVVEDSEHELDPGLTENFEREANVFASEVMFQLDGFSRQAEESEFGIMVPVRLSKTYGSSIYSAVRRYVAYNPRACAVVVLNPPVMVEGHGFRAEVRRRCASSAKFGEIFGEIEWPDFITPDHELGKSVPLYRQKITGRRTLGLIDRNGDIQECFAEGFTQSHQVFILIHAVSTLTARSVIIPATSIPAPAAQLIRM